MTVATDLWRWLAAHPGWAFGLVMLGGTIGTVIAAILAANGSGIPPARNHIDARFADVDALAKKAASAPRTTAQVTHLDDEHAVDIGAI